MALIQTICVRKTSDCAGFIIKETTGEYSVDNVGGYGSPNPIPVDFNYASIIIEKRNSDGTWEASDASPINVLTPTGEFPSAEYAEQTITAEDAGYGVDSTFDDGLYRITYQSGLATLDEYSIVYYYAHTCAIDNCYQEASLAASTCNCACDDINKRLSTIAFYHRELKAAKCCANPSLITKYIDMLTKLCADCGECSSCC